MLPTWFKIGLVNLTILAALLGFSPRAAIDYPYAYPPSFQERSSLFPQTWRNFGSDGLGYSAVDGLWSWPLDTASLVMGKFLRLPFWLITYLLFIIPISFLVPFGVHRLLASYQVSSPGGQLAGSFLYLFNTYALLLIDGGQLTIAAAYSLFPLVFALYRQALSDGRLLGSLQLTLGLWAITITDIRFLYIFFLLVLFAGWRHPLAHFRLFWPAGLLLVGLHAYWLLPAILSGESSLPSVYASPSQLDFLSLATYKHAALLLSPHWPQNVFGQITRILPTFLVIPLLVVLAVVVSPKKLAGFWVVLAALGIFLVKGATPPLGQVYSWAFTHLPGFFLFRDSSKFFVLIILSYCFLLASLSSRSRFLSLLTPIIVLLLAAPAFSGRTTGIFSPPRHQPVLASAADILSSDPQFGQVVWSPYRPPLGFSSPRHPTLEAAVLAQKRPFQIATVGTYERHNFLREAPNLEDLFQISGIGYLASAAPDPLRDPVKPDNLAYYRNFTTQLSRHPWLETVQSSSDFTLWRARKSPLLVFNPNETWFVVGSDLDLYRTSPPLTKNAYVFVEQTPGLISQIAYFPQAQVLLSSQKSFTDLAAGLLLAQNFFFPAATLGRDPDSSGWWKAPLDTLAWRAFLQSKYGLDTYDFDYSGGWAVAEGQTRRDFSLPSAIPGHVLLVRVMVSPKGGEIGFFQGENLLGQINTSSASTPAISQLTREPFASNEVNTYSRADFTWHEVGELVSNQPVRLVTTGSINVVNALAVVARSDWQSHLSQAQDLLNRPQTPSSSATVTSHRFSSTKYEVSISGPSGPSSLVFSQNYSPGWRLHGQPPLPAYGFIQVFSLPGSGSFDLEYYPQRFVLPGLFISAVTLLILIRAVFRATGRRFL